MTPAQALHLPNPRNENIQWMLIGLTMTVSIITVIAMVHQIKVNRLQHEKLMTERKNGKNGGG